MIEDDTRNRPSQGPIIKISKIAFWSCAAIHVTHDVLYLPKTFRDCAQRSQSIYVNVVKEQAGKVVRLVSDHLPFPDPAPLQDQDFPNKVYITSGAGATGPYNLPPSTLAGKSRPGPLRRMVALHKQGVPPLRLG